MEVFTVSGVPSRFIAGSDPDRPLSLLLVNAPLRDYELAPRVNDFTLPVIGMGYIATYAAAQGFNVGVLDAEAHGLSVRETIRIANAAQPEWVGFNLLAPTYEISATIAALLDESVRVMAGGHQAKAMPREILLDTRFKRLEALVLGEGETRVAALLAGGRDARSSLPNVMWLQPDGHLGMGRSSDDSSHFLSPDINALPFVNRRYLTQDPYMPPDGLLEAAMVGSRGCPYDCSFCGAAASANPDIKIRVRTPENIIAEMQQLSDEYGVEAFRFVDDLFLAYLRFIRECMPVFEKHGVGKRWRWDATGRINVLSRAGDELYDSLAANGCREVALGIESGSPRLLQYIDKRITPEMVKYVVDKLTSRGINVKGYFILGFPTETIAELNESVRLIHELWSLSDTRPGWFKASVFEFRPYQGTPEWTRLMQTGRFTSQDLLNYTRVDLTNKGVDESMRARDEFNFSVGIQFGEAALEMIRQHLAALSREQHARNRHQ
jgi:anaerobic magnesium-protoporphyrin IX monomethyl ester cyclase